MCVCVCVCERERERVRETLFPSEFDNLTASQFKI